MITSKSSPNLIEYDHFTEPISPPYINLRWKKEIQESMVYLKGLPTTTNISSLTDSLKRGIFSKEPTLIYIFTDKNKKSTGKAYIEFEDHNIKDIIRESNGYVLKHDNITFTILTNQCRERPKNNYEYIYLESYGVWRRNWSELDIHNFEK